MNSNLIGKFSYIDSMIPVITENSLEISHKAKMRAYRKEILQNSFDCADDLYCLVSITSDIMKEQDQVLMNLLYSRFEYLGFEAKEVSHREDMSFKEKVTFFCSNFMNYFDNNGESNFIDEMTIR